MPTARCGSKPDSTPHQLYTEQPPWHRQDRPCDGGADQAATPWVTGMRRASGTAITNSNGSDTVVRICARVRGPHLTGAFVRCRGPVAVAAPLRCTSVEIVQR